MKKKTKRKICKYEWRLIPFSDSYQRFLDNMSHYYCIIGNPDIKFKALNCPKHNRILIGKGKCTDCEKENGWEKQLKKDVKKSFRMGGDGVMRHAWLPMLATCDMVFDFTKKQISQSHTQYVKELEDKIKQLPKYDLSRSGISGGYYLQLSEVLSLLKDLKVQKGEI